MVRKALTLTLIFCFALSPLFSYKQVVAYAKSKTVQTSTGDLSDRSDFSGHEELYNKTMGRLSPLVGMAGHKSVAVRVAGQGLQSPTGDYGDAPDGSLAGYEEPYNQVIGRFPTLYNTTNSRVGRPGAHALVTGEETLGSGVSREMDANDPTDPDGTGNLVDEDRFDDCLRIGFDDKDPDTPSTIDIVVSVAPTAPAGTRFINVLADLNHDGAWQQFGATEEWIIKNQQTNLAPGSQGVAARIPFDLIEQASPVWIRVALTRAPINEADFTSVGGWDGSGEFQFGEVEDHFLPVARAIGSAFGAARAAASACASCSFMVVGLAQALDVAQDNERAIAAALAQAQASASAAALAASNAQSSAQTAAQASAQASDSAQQALTLIVQIPCVTLSASMQAQAEGVASCAADAAAVAAAQASAAAAAAAEADAKARAISVALAEAQAASVAIASALAIAQARAAACAQAVAEARAAAQAAALAISFGGRSAYAAAVARAVAVAQAWATAQANCQAIALAFAGAQADAQASARALAIAGAAAEAAATAAATAQAGASAAASAAASASAAAQTSASVLGSAQALFDPNCTDQICECVKSGTQITKEVRVKPGENFTIALSDEMTSLPQTGKLKFLWVRKPATLGLTLNQDTGQVSGNVQSQATGTYQATVIAVDTCVVARFNLTLVVSN